MSKMNEKAIRAMRDFLDAIGVDIEARGMEKTPERVAEMYQFLFDGMGKDTSAIWGETFDAGSDGIVAVRNIPFYSMCEHHLVPFFGEVSIAYLPTDGRVAGFSKFSKLVEVLSHQPQLQERLTAQIAAAVQRDLQARGVLVVVEAKQLCMTMRGDLAHGTRTVTSEKNGVFQTDSALYQQAWMILGGEKS
ncbi:GTP cyclohydrolase I [Selenomonas sp. WCT3]|nr:GTP cyclohydrolase I [Selenomonas ruminantium]